MFNIIASYLVRALYIVPVYFISLTLHELAHGYTAYRLGDPTAKDAGRLTFNPFAHLDFYGLIMMVFFGFGWAKPVPVNPMFFKKPKKDMMFTALAGPLSNLAVAFVISFFWVSSNMMFMSAYFRQKHIFMEMFGVLQNFFMYMTTVNIALAVFNLIPIHPLDGSRVLNYFMPNSFNSFVNRYGTYIYIAFFVLLLSTPIFDIIVTPVIKFIYDAFTFIWYYPAQGLVNLVYTLT